MQHVHILGICGTFMGSLAQLAKAKGYRVTGCDQHVYPPMSTQLETAGIELVEGFGPEQLTLNPDMFVVGNVIARGNPLMEAILNKGLPYMSGPEWFARHIIHDRWVLAVSGTHGKTTTSSMLAWILEFSGFEPGYLIGGVPKNFDTSARLGGSSFFVVEADEYDSAFFDKRSKFIHYRPRTLVMNNLEYDHADIFPDLQAIQTQFHHLLRTVPGEGLVIYPADDHALQTVVAKGCWTPTQTLGDQWQGQMTVADGSEFEVIFTDKSVGKVNWSLTGDHNVHNALAAMAAARHVGVEPHTACEALCEFKSVKRRMDCIGRVGKVTVYDDFAHHPTAIETTLNGIRKRYPNAKITAVIEPRSNTMKQGVHKDSLQQACAAADTVFWLQPEHLSWQLEAGQFGNTEHHVYQWVSELAAAVLDQCGSVEEHIVVMSNGSFDGIHQTIIKGLKG